MGKRTEGAVAPSILRYQSATSRGGLSLFGGFAGLTAHLVDRGACLRVDVAAPRIRIGGRRLGRCGRLRRRGRSLGGARFGKLAPQVLGGIRRRRGDRSYAPPAEQQGS